MNAAAPPIDHASMARATMWSRANRGRGVWGLIDALLIGVAMWLSAVLPGTGTAQIFAGVVLFLAFASSIGLTSTALRVQRLFSGSAAPAGAMRAWRRGWMQAQAMLAALLIAVTLVESAWIAPAQASLWVLPGAIIVLQALAAWFSFLVARRARWRWALLAFGVPSLMAFGFGHALHALATPARAIGTLGLTGIAGLAFASMRLGPEVRFDARPLTPPMQRSALVRFMQRWTPLSSSSGGRWWRLWVSAGSNVVLVGSQSVSGIWNSPTLPIRLALLVWFTCMIAATLASQGLHWRVWLQPGGPRRHRLGRHLFASTLQVYLLILAPLLLVATGIAAMFGVSMGEIASKLASRAHLLVELLFAIGLAVLFSGWVFGRWSQNWIGGALAGAAIATMLALNFVRDWRHHAPPDAAFDMVYLPALLAATAVCVALADRVWARRTVGDPVLRRQLSEGWR